VTVSGPASYRLSAFGLCVRAPWRLPGATDTPSPQAEGARTLRVAWVPGDRLEETAWDEAERVFQPRFTDGKPHFTVRRGERGYWLSFDDFGRYAVSLDGREAECEADEVAVERCERFLFAQVLPLAAVLQGLDVMHASAVTWDSGVVAFVGPSGAGKTTVATRLMARGATLITDDALALEMTGGEIVAHPGPPFVAVAAADSALADGPPAWIGPRLGASDKPHFAPPVSAQALPVVGVYHLEQRSSFRVTVAAGEVVPRMLAHATAPYVLTPERLLQHLEVVTMLGSSVPQFSLTLPDGELSDDDLAELEHHIRGLGA
jgi:hypothetical protein